MFFFNPNFYYVSIVLQAICVYHCIRHGNQNKWIWIIVFLPFIGCLIYFFSEIVTGSEIGRVQSGLGDFINPSGSIRKLENNLRFSDTFANRIALADAYLASGDTDKAIAIYEESLKGAFEENEYVLSQLVVAYHRKKVFEKAVWAAEKIKRLP
ncbi:MAG: PLDc N-terminal domain-containing protein, partial [Flavisolibacter sp.]